MKPITLRNYKSFMMTFFVYFGFYLWLMPKMIILRTDDFSYLKSVIGFINFKGLYTYEWLAPYTYTQSAFCAVIYHITHHFFLSTWGVLALFTALQFFLLYALFSDIQNTRLRSLFTVTLCSLPFFFCHCLDFTNVLLQQLLILTAVFCYLNERFLLFFIMTFLAFMNRQNAVVLLSLPAWDFLTQRPKNILRFSMLLVTGTVIGHIYRIAPTNYARLVTTGNPIKIIGSGLYIQNLLTGLFFMLAIASLFYVFFSMDVMAGFKKNIRNPWIPLILSVVFIGLVFVSQARLIIYCAPVFNTVLNLTAIRYALAGLYFILIWFMDYSILRLHHPLMILIFAFIAVNSLNGVLFDRYFLEAITILILYLLSQNPIRVTLTQPALLKRCVLILTGVLLFNMGYGYFLKCTMDSKRAYILLYEPLLRSGCVHPQELSDAPFGYQAWKLYDFEVQTPARRYLMYLEWIYPNRVIVPDLDSWKSIFGLKGSYYSSGADGAFLAGGYFPIGLKTSYFKAIRLSQSPIEVRPEITNKIFPLTNQEWQAYIKNFQL